MKAREAPTWESAKWVGALDLPATFAPSIKLVDGDGYGTARLLVRRDRRPVAFLEIGIADSQIDGAELDALVSVWNSGPSSEHFSGVPAHHPLVSVVICTRNRAELLKEALGSVLMCDYANFEVIVVDNASDDDSTLRYVDGLADPRVRAISEPVPGLSGARNAGIKSARGELIAFTDDDVVVDKMWLLWFDMAMRSEPEVGCVTGLVPSGELRTPTQWMFEKQVHWSNLTRERFHISAPPAGNRLFPFQVGVYGAGANFAMPRSVLLELGGFDEGLGIGSPAGGGEDIDMFVRVLLDGRPLIYEPAVIAWHRHRSDLPALAAQAHGYGLGLGAWLTKVACDRTLRPMALKRMWDVALHVRGMMSAPEVEGVEQPAGLRRTQIAGLLRGPLAYARSRRQHRRARPLAGQCTSRLEGLG
jgi:glycosyltransferase involved in cell wall biosynthesis